ncbi:MAG: hypothetical protein ACYC2I_12370 [Elusimicrobiales bacterium]
MIMKKCAITIILSIMAGIGLVPAGSGAERAEAIRPDVSGSVSLEGYDIERVVDAVAIAMGDAARDYYLPDKPGNAKRIKRYTKESGKLILMNTSFKRELARVCVDVAKVAAKAGRDEEKLPGHPLKLLSGLSPVPVGVSSKTVSMAGETKIIFTNTMPCVNAAARALHSATLEQFPKTAADPAAKESYTHQFGNVLTGNRLYNHDLAEVCAKLVDFAERSSMRGW